MSPGTGGFLTTAKTESLNQAGLSCDWRGEVSMSEILGGIVQGQLECGGPECHICAMVIWPAGSSPQ